MKLYINFLQILLLPDGFLHTPKPFSDYVVIFPFNIENVVKLKYVLEYVDLIFIQLRKHTAPFSI
jgi:hypothetical protein